MRVLIWATTLQADILALALCLDQHPEHELLASNLDAYLAEPIAKVRPLQSKVIDRLKADVEGEVALFKPDVTVIDNHFPGFKCSTHIVKMWYGLGWKAPSKKALSSYYKDVRRLTGLGPDEKNPFFMAQCYGEHDRNWRIKGMRFHPDNCVIVGMPFADLIMKPPYTKQELKDHYTIDIERRKTLLVNFTWHYGNIVSYQPGLIGHIKRTLNIGSLNGSDEVFLRNLCEKAFAQNADVLFCMHDRWRYSEDYLAIYKGLKASYGKRIQIKHKDEHPDNLADLCVADVMVSNLSSFITFFYHRKNPSIHLCPVPRSVKNINFARLSKRRRDIVYRRANRDQGYMADPADNGGMTAYSRDECLKMISAGLGDQNICVAETEAFIAKRIHKADGQSAMRYVEAIEAFIQAPTS